MQQRFQVIRGRQAIEHAQDKMNSQELPGFEDALVAHLDSMFAFAMRLMKGDRGLAEDLVQETCLRALKNYQSLHSPEKIKTWFFQILVNIHINEFHRQSRELPIADVELSEALLDSANVKMKFTPEEILFEQLLDSEIQQALDALPVEFRAVVWLFDIEELSYKEISEIINRPIGTVASRLNRGHSLLREHLREYARKHGLMKE